MSIAITATRSGTQRLARRVTLTVIRVLDLVAVALYDSAGVAQVAAHHSHGWLAPRVARLDAEVDRVAVLRRARRATGRAFVDMSQRVGWTLDDLRGLKSAFSSLPWDEVPELTAGSPVDLELAPIDPRHPSVITPEIINADAMAFLGLEPDDKFLERLLVAASTCDVCGSRLSSDFVCPEDPGHVVAIGVDLEEDVDG